MAHARIKQQEHGHVHMHTCVATLATGLTRHDEHAYGMSRGLQPRPFCRVDRQRGRLAAVRTRASDHGRASLSRRDFDPIYSAPQDLQLPRYVHGGYTSGYTEPTIAGPRPTTILHRTTSSSCTTTSSSSSAQHGIDIRRHEGRLQATHHRRHAATSPTLHRQGLHQRGLHQHHGRHTTAALSTI